MKRVLYTSALFAMAYVVSFTGVPLVKAAEPAKPRPAAKKPAAPPKKAPAARPVVRAAKAPAARIQPAAKQPARQAPKVTTPPQGSMLQSILLSGTLRICVRTDIPPLGYFHGATLSGFDIALAQELAIRIGIQYKRELAIQWVVISAEERISSLQKGRCDVVVAAFSNTSERAKKVGFSRVYYQTQKVVLRKTKVSTPPVVAHVRKTTTGNFKVPGVVYSTFLSYHDILHTMRKKLVDYVITDRPIGRYLLRLSGSGYQWHKTLDGQESYSVGVGKKHSHLLSAINKALTQLQQSGRIAHLQRRWLR